VDWKVGTVDGDAPTSHGAQGLNRRQAFTLRRGRHGERQWSVVDGQWLVASSQITIYHRPLATGLCF
jgi:hypothetical protein